MIPIELFLILPTVTVPIDHRDVSSARYNCLSTGRIVVLPKSTILPLPITNIALSVLLGPQGGLFTQLVLHLHSHEGGL